MAGATVRCSNKLSIKTLNQLRIIGNVVVKTEEFRRFQPRQCEAQQKDESVSTTVLDPLLHCMTQLHASRIRVCTRRQQSIIRTSQWLVNPPLVVS